MNKDYKIAGHIGKIGKNCVSNSNYSVGAYTKRLSEIIEFAILIFIFLLIAFSEILTLNLIQMQLRQEKDVFEK